MRRTTCLVVGVSLAVLSGCARVRVDRVNGDSTLPGVHFYEPRPYLLVSKRLIANGGGVEHRSEIIWLPDHSKRYRVTVEPGWGSVDGSVKLINGWMLSDLGAKMDSKIPETITAFSSLIDSAAADDTDLLGLYRINIDANGDLTLSKQPLDASFKPDSSQAPATQESDAPSAR